MNGRFFAISVFLACISLASCQFDDEGGFDDGRSPGKFNDDGGEERVASSDDDSAGDAGQTGPGLKKLGPFNTSLESEDGLSLVLSWTVFIEDESDDRLNDIEFRITTNSDRLNWMAFGFTKDNDFAKADWFVAWKSLRKNRIYTRDCNSMQGVLHFDRNQDYDMTGSRRLQSFNMTVRRALNTGDKFDIIIDKAKATTLIWAHGFATKFSKIRHEIKDSWKSKKIEIITGKALKIDTDSENQRIEEEKTKPLRDDTLKRNKEASKTDVKKVIMEETKKEGSATLKMTNLGEANSKTNTSVPCTVVVKYTQTWLEYIKWKERSVYYAILGSAAIMTGMIVIILACCCRKNAPDPRKSKVSFYKVDDYEDEQIEFLKERA